MQNLAYLAMCVANGNSLKRTLSYRSVVTRGAPEKDRLARRKRLTI